jgi:hypothetical protein
MRQILSKRWRLYLLLSILFIILLFIVYKAVFPIAVPGINPEKLKELQGPTK